MGHAHTPPQLPEVSDEAGNTPHWVPLLGALLFVSSVVAIVVCHGSCREGEAGDDAADSAP